MAADHVVDFLELHAEAEVGLVGAEAAHGVVPGDAREGAELESFEFEEEVADEAFEHLEDVLLVDEGHLAVNLCEFRLAVCAQIFVAEATDDLEVAVEAGDHEELFVLLWGLWEGVELAGVHAGRDDEVACAFGGGLDEHGGFDLEEVAVGEVVAYEHGHAVA